MVFEGYGLTETSPVVAANTPEHKRLGTVGKPLPGIRVVLDHSVTEDATDAFGQTIKESHLVAPFISRLAQDLAQILRSEQGGVNPPSKPTVALVMLRREKRAVFAPRRTVSTQM